MCLHYREGCSHSFAECTSSMVLVNTLAGSRVQAVERDLLVAYLVIDIRGIWSIISAYQSYTTKL